MTGAQPKMAFVVAFALSCNGRDYAAGADIELDEALARPLLEAGAIRLPAAGQATVPPATDKAEAERLQGELSGAELRIAALQSDLAEAGEALESARKRNAELTVAHGEALAKLEASVEAEEAAKKAHAAEVEALSAQLTKAQADLAAAAAAASKRASRAT
ncbi:hypothetical protein ACG04Q_11865 [Roseateles sp. DXS20W]|uniref:Uncharacterized protein n=1 Tax=Pelomonas lactea TaxID=3299030 RepID=A0ABW7GJY5_9BURK